MIVSLNWLKEYVDFQVDHDTIVDRLTMSGLNHEGSEAFGEDQAIDLEVTSNRADCLGHIGVAREVAALFDLTLKIPDATAVESTESVQDHCSVEIQCDSLCYRYTARLLKGVKVGPSPDWLVKRLETIGVASVNNVVDATNYVMFECGQPLHAFDFSKISGGKIVVREPKPDESLVAIDHKSYPLQPGMCVIADAENAVCIGGVMGGADSEVSESTTDVLLEAAYFSPMSVRSTARSLNLHSPSSFRFERDIDSHNTEWASQRCAQLILQIAGGDLCSGMIDVGQRPVDPTPVTLRLAQLKRVLGIQIPQEEVPKILSHLGLGIDRQTDEAITITPPTWRKDITREIDLVEEIGRIYGYDKVPDDVSVPMVASVKPDGDRVMAKIRNVLTSAGFDEAMTASMVPKPWSDAFTPWTDAEAIVVSQPMLGVLEKGSENIGAVDLVRRSLVPSLIEARRINDFRSNNDVELFETAKVYLAESATELPREPLLVGLVSSRNYLTVKGLIEAILKLINPSKTIEVVEFEHPLFDADHSVELRVDGKRLGFLGEVSDAGKKQFKIRTGVTTVAEFDTSVLAEAAVLVPIHQEQSRFQAISRDFNFVVEDRVHWQDLESTVRKAGGELCEAVYYRETFRDEKRDGAGKKRLLMSVVLRSSKETLSGHQADETCSSIVDACKKDHSAELVA